MSNPKAPRKDRVPSALTGVPQPPEPKANMKTVLDWVGGDPMRARAALEGEKQGRKRTRLISQLESMIVSGHRI